MFCLGFGVFFTRSQGAGVYKLRLVRRVSVCSCPSQQGIPEIGSTAYVHPAVTMVGIQRVTASETAGIQRLRSTISRLG